MNLEGKAISWTSMLERGSNLLSPMYSGPVWQASMERWVHPVFMQNFYSFLRYDSRPCLFRIRLSLSKKMELILLLPTLLRPSSHAFAQRTSIVWMSLNKEWAWGLWACKGKEVFSSELGKQLNIVGDIVGWRPLISKDLILQFTWSDKGGNRNSAS